MNLESTDHRWGKKKRQIFPCSGMLEKLALVMLNRLPSGCSELLCKEGDGTLPLESGGHLHSSGCCEISLLMVPRTDPERLKDTVFKSAFPPPSIILSSGFHSLCLGRVRFKS